MTPMIAFVLISWIIAFYFILGAVVYETETEPVANLTNITDSFSEDIPDILDHLRKFISLTETANQRLGEVLKIKLETTIPSQSLETEPLDALFNRYEASSRSFRNRFISFMSFQAINSRTEKLSGGYVRERFSEFENSIVKPKLDRLAAGIQTKISSSEFNSNDKEINEKTAYKSFIDEIKISNLPIKTENESIDESDNNFSLDRSVKVTEKTSSVQTKVTINNRLSTGLTEKANETVKNKSTTESLTDDGEVIIEEDESPTEPATDEVLNTLISNKTTISEYTIAKDDEKNRLNRSTIKSSDPDSLLDASTLSVDENEKNSDDSEEDADLILHSHKTDSKLEFLFRLSFEESYHPLFVSYVGKSGKHFPNYSRIPETSFACEDQKYIPGVYADTETRCQVFHVCWPHILESFLCPIGTIFNQQARSCDNWFSFRCSRSANYFALNANFFKPLKPVHPKIRNFLVLHKLDRQKSPTLSLIARMKFLPIHIKVSDYPEKQFLFDAEELNEFDQYYPKSKNDSRLSKEEINLAKKVCAKLLYSPQNFGAKNDKFSNLDNLFPKKELRLQKNENRKEFVETRSGLIAEIGTTENSNTGSSDTKQSNPQIAELDTINKIWRSKSLSQAPLFKNKYLHSNTKKNPMAFKVFEIREDVFDQRILPQTKKMLAINYSKLSKRKKL